MGVGVGERLVREGLVTEEQLASALRMQAVYGGRIGNILVELGIVPADAMVQALGRELGVPFLLDRHLAAADPALSKLVPMKIAQRARAVPIAWSSSRARTAIVAFADPANLAAVDEVAAVAGVRIEPALAIEARLAATFARVYGAPLDPVPSVGAAQRFVDVDRGGIELELDDLGGAPLDLADDAPRSSHRSFGRPSSAAAMPRVSTTMPQVSKSTAAMPRVSPSTANFPAVAPSTASPPRASAPSLESAPPLSTAHPTPLAAGSGAVGSGLAAPSKGRLLLSMPPPSRVSPEIPPLAAPIDRAIEAIEGAPDPGAIVDRLVEFLTDRFEVALVLTVRAGAARAVGGFAPGADRGLLASIALPLAGGSVLLGVVEARRGWAGAPATDPVLASLASALRCVVPRFAILAPIVAGDDVLGLVYAHGVQGTTAPRDAALEVVRLCDAAAAAGLRLARARAASR